jgi:hypothetical protein
VDADGAAAHLGAEQLDARGVALDDDGFVAGVALDAEELGEGSGVAVLHR